MFSGIIQCLGEVRSTQFSEEGSILGVVSSSSFVHRLERGASVAVDGVCLTVVRFEETGLLLFDVIQETLALTTIKGYRVGSRVNLERSLKFGDEVGGHMVTGHVCGVGEIIGIRKNLYEILLPSSLSSYAFAKGCIAIDGVSLTIISVQKDVICVGLIPETLSRTTLGYKSVGDSVNIEPDMSTKVHVDTLSQLCGKST